MKDDKVFEGLKEKEDIERVGRENVLFDSEEPEGESVRGFDFENGMIEGVDGKMRVDYDKLIDSYRVIGFQASHFGKAIEIINKMIKEKVTIYLGYTSNLVTSGLRDIFCYLAKNKKVDVIVTTAGGIEEDFVKCFSDFKLGKFSLSGELLNKKGINRTGNILVPNSRYCDFEDFFTKVLERLYERQKKDGKIISVSELIKELGKEIDNEKSIYYWCYKNNIDVYCPAITDGAIGDNIHFFLYKHSDFKIDIASDIHKLNEFTITRKKTGIILLGSGVMKHHILNTNMMRNGADYSVYINTGEEWDGADSNARPDEAVSWGKLRIGEYKNKIELESDDVDNGIDEIEKERVENENLDNISSIKVFGDATILFPLIVGKCFC